MHGLQEETLNYLVLFSKLVLLVSVNDWYKEWSQLGSVQKMTRILVSYVTFDALLPYSGIVEISAFGNHT